MFIAENHSRLRKYRESEKKCIVEGKNSVYEGIESDFNCEIVFVTNKFASEEDQFIKNLESRNFKVAILKSVNYNKISDTKAIVASKCLDKVVPEIITLSSVA